MNTPPAPTIHDHLSEVLENRSVGGSCFLLTLESEPIATRARPGQFVMLRFPDCRDPLLPRPMSVSAVQGTRIEILHKVVGRGTAMLARLDPGDSIQILGPLGKPFGISDPPSDSQRAVLIAGGIGVAIFPLLIPELRARGWRPELLYGGRSAADLVERERFEGSGVPVRAATEDGTFGLKGRVTRLLEEALVSGGRIGIAYACGPQAMLRAVAETVNAAGIPGQLSLESAMGCGIGACLGCVTRIEREEGVTGYARICVEGPNFDAREVRWE